MRTIKTFFAMALAIASMAAVSCTGSRADDKTRPAGIYPGRLSECSLPTWEDDNEYRNLALHRQAWGSESYDFNLTPQLLTDGIVTKENPAWIETFANGKRVSRRERESAIDGGEYTCVRMDGPEASLAFIWHGMIVMADSMKVQGRVFFGEGSMPGSPYMRITSSGKQIASLAGDGKRIAAKKEERSTDANKQTALDDLPSKTFSETFRIGNTEIDSLALELGQADAISWEIREVTFYRRGQMVTDILPSFLFHSAYGCLRKDESRNDCSWWAYVDLGARPTLDKVVLHWISLPEKCSISVSDDAKEWKHVADADGRMDEIKLPSGLRGQYVRCDVESGKPSMLSEMEVYGQGGRKAVPALSAGLFRWKLQRASETAEDGKLISAPGYDDNRWIAATVPATVLTSFVNIEAVQNPNFDDDIYCASESYFNSRFWYRSEFEYSPKPGKRIFLNLDGINWKATIWINSQKAGRVEGAFKRGQLDVTPLVKDGANCIAVEIEPCAHPGGVKEKNETSTDRNGGILGYDNPTFHATIGWDWITTVRGRDIGIWNDIYMTDEDKVILQDALIESKLGEKDTLATLYPEVIAINTTDAPLDGTINGWVSDVRFSKKVHLEPGRNQIALSPDEMPELRDKALRLWWPNGYGEPYLHKAGFSFEDASGEIARTEFLQGIREFRYEDVSTALKIYCNGIRITPLGGNWGFSEHNLNYRAREYDAAVRYHKEMNFNMIRDWVGQIGDEEFYDACDRWGILIWQDFWLANPADGPDPLDEDMFLDNARDYIQRIRHHASIALYCGRNEGYPTATLDKGLRELLSQFHNDIVYISSSADDGVSGHGPYQSIDIEEYFRQQTGKLHSERGMPNVMSYESMERTLRPEHMWPQNIYWGQHDYTQEGAQCASSFNRYVYDAFGEANDAKEFTELAQWRNYEGYRGMYEAQNVDRQGLLIWMSHPCWPSMTWQTYDYYLEPTAAYFGAKKACEPLHVQYNPLTSMVEVINHGARSYSKLKVKASVLDINGKPRTEKEAETSSMIDTSADLIHLDSIAADEVSYLRLEAWSEGKLISSNTYLVPRQKGNLKALRSLAKSQLKATATFTKETATVHLEVPEDSAPALLVRLNLKDTKGVQILPVIYSDNYICMMPGEKRDIEIRWADEDNHTSSAQVEISGLNLMLKSLR